MRRLARVALAAFWIGGSVAAVAQGAMQFEVASVRQNKSSDPPRSNMSLANGNAFSEVAKRDVPAGTGGHFSATNQGLFRYIAFAYNLNGTQYLALRFKEFAGGGGDVPAWVRSDGFDIQAKAEGDASIGQMRLMMQTLLAQRFGLAVHFETRQMPVDALVPVKAGAIGPDLRRHTSSCDVPVAGLPPVCGVIAHLPPSVPGRNSFGGRDVSLGLLASSLVTQTGMAMLPHPVIDRTGLTCTYDLSLEWIPELHAPQGVSAESQPEDAGPSFREALKEQLGLKLVPDKGPVEVLVIDHVERPTEN